MSDLTTTSAGSAQAETAEQTDRAGRAERAEQGLEFFATCPKGFEHLLADELSAQGVPRVRALRGQVGFGGGLEDAYRACLWSRMASRVTLVLARVDATSSDALYEGMSHIPWQDHVPAGATIAVEAHGTNAALRNTQFTAVRAKDAIVDVILARRGTRPMVDVRHADVSVAVRVSRERATVGIDLSGAPLFRRGYEAARSGRAPIAPLRPDYAAALLAAGGWYRSVRHGSPVLASVYDGAGSLLVEAAAQALDRAPGLLRTHWGFEGWGGHDHVLWEKILVEARERAEAAVGARVVLLAHDTRPGAETAARHALRAAGMDVEPTFVDAGDMATKLGRACASGGPLVAMDLSWLDEGAVAAEAAAMSECVAAAAGVAGKPATVVALAKDAALDSALGREADGTVDVLVGQDDATIRTFDAAGLPREHASVSVTEPRGRQVSVPVLVDASDQFARRLQKVWRLRRKWAEREDVSCYRIYDSDLPDYSVSIDLFQGSELMPARGGRGRWLQVYEYAAPRSVDATLARRRLLDVLAIAPRVIGVAPENVFVRVRTHGKGGSQYAAESRDQRVQAGGQGRDRRDGGRPGRRPGDGRVLLPRGAHLVDEGGLTFEVNFDTRLDCGIFLDHRETRSLVREMMKKTVGSKRFLNLFAYTGTATCYAADGGAKHTTTVDMSRPSLEWARRNMERNGFVSKMRPPEHEYVQADVLAWVQEQRHSKNRWDLIFCDVPTFSNSSRMRGSWDVQRDHAELVIGISRLLTRNGSAIFSCNLRGFKPDVEKLQRAGVSLEDITAETIPEDFQRNAKIHHCYIVRRTA